MVLKRRTELGAVALGAVVAGLTLGTALSGAQERVGEYKVETELGEVVMCEPGDTLEVDSAMVDTEAPAHGTALAAAQAELKSTSAALLAGSPTAELRELVAPGIGLTVDDSWVRAEARHGDEQIVAFDLQRSTKNGASVTTVRIEASLYESGWRVDETYTCTGELVTDADAYVEALRERIGPVPAELTEEAGD